MRRLTTSRRLVVVALIAGAAVAPAPASAEHAAPDPELAEAARTRWIQAIDRLQAAGASLEAGVRAAGDELDRVSTLFRVQLRHALAAGEQWLATVTAPVTAAIVVPDLTVLVAEPVKGIESSGFGWREDPINRRKKFHKGTDYKADRGTPVHAAGAGVVIFCGRQRGYGKVIYLDHGGGLVTRYAHLRSIGVKKGDAVAADARIGEVGSTGRTTGPHLHFEVRIDGRAVDPVLALHVAALQRTQPPAIARIAAMSLLPEVQAESVSAHDPPKGHKGRKNRPERSGRTRRAKPLS